MRVVMAPAKVLASAAIVMTTGAAGPYLTMRKTIVPTKTSASNVSRIRLPPGDAHDWSQQYHELHGHGWAPEEVVVVDVTAGGEVLIRLLVRSGQRVASARAGR